MYALATTPLGQSDSSVTTYKTLEDFRLGLRIQLRDILMGIHDHGPRVVVKGYHFSGGNVSEIEIKFINRFQSASEYEYVYKAIQSDTELFELTITIIDSEYDG